MCFQGGTPGPRELCFSYGSYVERVIVTLTAGDPAELKLISVPDQVRKGSVAHISQLCYTLFFMFSKVKLTIKTHVFRIRLCRC